MNNKTKKLKHPQWFFMWTSGGPCISSICSWTKKDLIKEVELMQGRSWKSIYKGGGRAIKCNVTPKVEVSE